MLTRTQRLRRLTVSAAVLLIMLLALIAGVWWQDQQDNANLETTRVIDSLRIERADARPVQLQRINADDDSAAHWYISEPCELQVNAQRLAPLLDALTPSAHGYRSDEVDLQAAGLLEPVATLRMNGETLLLGASDLSGERRYLQRGDRVEFVPEWILPMINGGLSALAVPDVFPGGVTAVTVLAGADDRNTTNTTNTADSADSANFTNAPDAAESAEAMQVAEIPETAGVAGSDVAIWQSLQARQILSWPLMVDDPIVAERELLVETPDDSHRVHAQDHGRFVALRVDNGLCAYIIERSSLPDNVFP